MRGHLMKPLAPRPCTQHAPLLVLKVRRLCHFFDFGDEAAKGLQLLRLYHVEFQHKVAVGINVHRQVRVRSTQRGGEPQAAHGNRERRRNHNTTATQRT